MILDEYNELCDESAVQLATSTAVIGDVIPLYNTTNYPGDGEPLYLVVTIAETIATAITGGTAAAGTAQFFLVSDSLSTLGGGTLASCTEHARSAVITTDDYDTVFASSTLYPPNSPGAVVMCVPLPSTKPYEKYLGLLCTTATTAPAQGKINAFLTRDPQRWRAYANAI